MSKKRTRNRRGRGTVWEVRAGVWKGQISLGFKPDGTRDRPTVTAETEQLAWDELDKLRLKAKSGERQEPSKATIAEFLDEWLKRARGTIEDTTWWSYEEKVRIHIKPAIGLVPLSKITALHVEAVLSKMRDAGLAAGSLKYALAVMRRAFGRAVKWRLLPYNPCGDVETPHVPKHEFQVWDAAQTLRFIAFLEASRHPLRLLFLLAIETGPRQGELLAIRPTDCDPDRGTIAIQRAVAVVQRKRIFKEPKNPRSRRKVTLPSRSLAALKDHLATLPAKSDLLFPNDDGGPLSRSVVTKSFQRAAAAAGLPVIRFHDLRHGQATLLLSAGASPKIVSERLGHSSITVTMDTYSHVIPGMQEAAAATIDGLLDAHDRQRVGSAKSEKPPRKQSKKKRSAR